MKKWLGSETKCDICKKEFSEVGNVFYDAKTVMGAWGLLCHKCFILHTDGTLGIGHGQEYEVGSKNLLRGSKNS